MAETRAIYPADAAERLRRHAGKPYRPSNGSEGDYFEAAWCQNCRRRGDSDNACRILVSVMAYSVRDPEYPREWVYGADGQPCCTAFTDKHAPRPAYRCKATVDLFGSAGALPSPTNAPARAERGETSEITAPTQPAPRAHDGDLQI